MGKSKRIIYTTIDKHTKEERLHYHSKLMDNKVIYPIKWQNELWGLRLSVEGDEVQILKWNMERHEFELDW